MLYRNIKETRRWLRALEIAKAIFWFEGYHTRYLEEIEEFIRSNRMYSPKIKKEFITPLYELSKARKIPMTKVINKIIKEYLEKNGMKSEKAKLLLRKIRKS